MSSCSGHNAPAAADWQHGLQRPILAELRRIIPPFNDAAYRRLCKGASAAQWADALERYAIFQRLKRRVGESVADHRRRQKTWFSERWRGGLRATGFYPAGPPPIGPHMMTPEAFEEIADNDPGLDIIKCSPTARLVILDLAGDKSATLRQISALFDEGRRRIGIEAAVKRGPVARKASLGASEVAEFLRKAQGHHIVRLWDLQLAGPAKIGKLETALVLYQERKMVDITEAAKRALLIKIATAQSLQDEAGAWIEKLRASGVG